MHDLIDIMALCAMLGGCNPATAYRYVKQGKLPKAVKIGGRSRWIKTEVNDALAKLAEVRHG